MAKMGPPNPKLPMYEPDREQDESNAPPGVRFVLSVNAPPVSAYHEPSTTCPSELFYIEEFANWPLSCGCVSHADGSGEQCATAERDRLRAVNAELLAALKEIVKGKGEFSLDPLEHAANTINNMKERARAAIAKAEEGKP